MLEPIRRLALVHHDYARSASRTIMHGLRHPHAFLPYVHHQLIGGCACRRLCKPHHAFALH